MSHIEEIKDDLETLKAIILEKVPTDQIWLFGSYAYGTPHKDSDIDIYRNRFDYRAENFSMERKIKKEGVKIYG